MTGSIVWVAAYPFGMALISLPATFFLRETRDEGLADIRQQKPASAETR